MKDALKELKLNDGLESRRIQMLWNGMMPAGVTRATTGIEFFRHKLVIHLSNALRQELSMGKDKIMARLNEQLPPDMQIREVILK